MECYTFTAASFIVQRLTSIARNSIRFQIFGQFKFAEHRQCLGEGKFNGLQAEDTNSKTNQSKQNSKVIFKHLQRKAVNHSVHGRQSKEETSASNLPSHILKVHICAVSYPSSSRTRRKCLHQHKTSMPLLNSEALQHS